MRSRLVPLGGCCSAQCTRLFPSSFQKIHQLWSISEAMPNMQGSMDMGRAYLLFLSHQKHVHVFGHGDLSGVQQIQESRLPFPIGSNKAVPSP